MTSDMPTIEAFTESPFGRCRVKFWRDYVVVFSATNVSYPESPGYDPPLTINGVDYSVWLYLGRYGGEWGLQRQEPERGPDTWNTYQAISMRRLGNGERESDAARRKVLTVLLPYIIRFIEEHPALVELGERKSDRDDLARLEEERGKLEEKLAEVNGKIAEVVDRVAEPLRY